MGLRAEGGWGRWLPVAIAAAFLVAVFVSPAGAFFVRACRPAFTVGAEGVRRHDGVLLPWDALQGAVLFDCQGEEHLGLRLKDGVASLAGRPLAEVLRRDLDWRAHGMPLVTMPRVLAIPRQELLSLFEAHGVRVVGRQDSPANRL